MPRLLEEAFKRLRELPENRQDSIARLILEQVERPKTPVAEDGQHGGLPVGWLRGWKVPDSF